MKKTDCMMLNKKSQAAIFMVVGLLIVIGGTVFFYSTQKAAKPIEPEIKIVQEQVPVEFDPIRKYANECAYSVGVEGLKIIGTQGGYISFADKALNKESFATSQNPTESDLVYFAKGSELAIPYWWYLKSSNNCKEDCRFASKRPELRRAENSVEKQLERYVDLKFRECLNNFEPFVGQGFKISEAGKLKTDVSIGKEDVIVLVEYPLSIERQDAKASISQFPARLPVNLEKIHELATKITNLEIKHRYLEKHALNLIVSFSGVDREKLPPMSDMQFKFGSSTTWQKSDIKNRITSMLTSYIPLFQIDGTYNYERNTFNSELKQRLYDSTIIPVANSSFKDLSAQFTYLDFWPAYFDLNCKGENCRPSSANSLISFFGIQQYRFAYDLSFPVLVEVQDPFALKGQGYTFSFFLEGNIRNNRAMTADFAPLETSSLSESSLLCESKTSGNITINAVNAATGNPVDDAAVLYTVTDESCFIGSTSSDGSLKESFPVGIGGAISMAKNGFIGKSLEFEPRINTDAALRIELSPIYTKKLVVKKKNVVKTPQGWQFNDAPLDLGPKESATVTLTRANEEGELDFSSIGYYESNQKDSSNASERSETRSQLPEIEIAPGNYAADISLVLDERIVIPQRKECFTKGIFGEKECVTIPPVDFGERAAPGQAKFPAGGLKLNFTISLGDLEDHSTIVLYIINIDIANVQQQDRVVEDLEQMDKIEEYSGIYQLALHPAFQ